MSGATATATAADPVPFRVTASGVELAGLRCGEGLPVVLLHGWPMTAHEWRFVLPELCLDHDVIAFDLPGLGGSQPPPGGDYSTGYVADVLVDAITALGIAQYALVGHDIGGMIAASLALSHRDRLTSLTLIEAPIPGIGDWAEMQSLFWHFGFHQTPDLPEKLIAGRERDYVYFFYQRDAVSTANIMAEDIDIYAEASSHPPVLRAGFDYYRAMERSAAQNRAALQKHGRYSGPTLSVAGSASNADKQEPRTRCLAETVKAVVLDRCGHFVPEERPAELAQALRRHLGQAPHGDTPVAFKGAEGEAA